MPTTIWLKFHGMMGTLRSVFLFLGIISSVQFFNFLGGFVLHSFQNCDQEINRVPNLLKQENQKIRKTITTQILKKIIEDESKLCCCIWCVFEYVLFRLLFQKKKKPIGRYKQENKFPILFLWYFRSIFLISCQIFVKLVVFLSVLAK